MLVGPVVEVGVGFSVKFLELLFAEMSMMAGVAFDVEVVV